MDFIGNLLNQMSSAFNQETAIPKKEEISMDETLKWRALKNNQFASRTRGGAAAAAAATTTGPGATGSTVAAAEATRSDSSIGRRSSGRSASNGQRKQQQQQQQQQQRTSSSENSNDSTVGGADGLLSGLEEDGSSCSALLATNGTGDGDDPEDDIEIEIAKDISGEELQEALGLSQLLVEVEPMDVGGTMGEEQRVVPPEDDQQRKLTVEKREPNGSQADAKETLARDSDRKLEAGGGAALEERGTVKNSTSPNDPPSEDQKVEIKEKKNEGERSPGRKGLAAANDREASSDDRDEKLPSNGPTEGSTTSASGIQHATLAEPAQTDDRITEEAKKINTVGEGENTGLKGQIGTTDGTAPDLVDDEDDDDVLIISTEDMTDVVELAETSKEEEDDEENEEETEVVRATVQKSDDHAEPHVAVPVEPVVNKQAQDVDPVALPKTTQTAIVEAEEKYDPSSPRADAGEKSVVDCESEEAKFSSTLAAANGQATDGNSSTEPKPSMVEDEKPATRHESTKEKEESGTGDAKTLGGGRTTRSKKAASVVVVAVTESSSSATPSQRRSQRFQAKEPAAAAAATGGRKSTDLKLNGSEPQSDGANVVVVKEEEPDEGMARRKTIASGGGAASSGKAPSKTAGVAGVSSLERSASVVSKSGRSLRSRQQSTSSGGPVASGPAAMVTRRSSETVKSVGLDDSNETTVDTAGADRMLVVNRRGRKRLSQEPTPTEAANPVVREKAARETTPTKEEPMAVGGDLDFPVDPGENDSGGKSLQEHEQPEQQEQKQQQHQVEEPQPAPAAAAVPVVVAAATGQRRGRKRKTQNPPEPSGGGTSAVGAAASSGMPEKPPPYKRAARVSRDGSDGILASALARRDKVDPQGRLSRPIKLSAKMLANEELRHGFEQHNNSRIIIGSDSYTQQGHDEPPTVERERDRDRTEAGSSEKSRKQQQQQQQQEAQEVNLPPANSAISSSSEDVMVVSVTYPTGKGPVRGSQQYPVGKDTPSAGRKQTEAASTSDRQRAPSGKSVSGALAGNVSKRPAGGPSAPTSCPDVQTFLQEIRASRIGINRSPEDNRKLNRRQTKRLAKMKEKHLRALGLQRKGATTQQHPVRNGSVVRARKSSADVDEDGLLLSEPEPESESSGSEADFVPSQKIGTVGKPSVTLRLRKPETLLESSPVNVPSAAGSSRQQQQQQRQQQPLVTVPSAMVNRGSVGRQPGPVSRQQQQHGGSSKQQQLQANNGRMGANSRRSSAAIVLPAAMTTASSVARKDQETEELQRSLERFGCELTVIPTSTGTPPASEGRSSSTINRKRAKEPTPNQSQQRSMVRPNHHHPPPPHRTQAAASPAASSALASTSPSLQIVLEKRPPSSSSERRKISSTSTPGGSMGSPPSAAGARALLCLCRQTSDIYVDSSAGTGYCTAVDDIDGQRIGCCNELAEELVHMLRPSPTVSFQLLCNLHRKRLEDHSCCAICGVYCTQGNFAMCKNAHIFHPDCAVKYILNAPYDPTRPGDHTAPTLVLQCPHCGQECPNGEIQVTVQLTTPPVLLPSRKNIVNPAKMAIVKSKGNRTGGSSAKDAFRANVDAFVPSSVRSVLAASGGPTNGHDPKRSNPMVAGGSGTSTRSHFSTKQIFDAIHKDNVDRITEIIISGFDIETRFRDFHDGTCLHLVSNFGSIGMAYLIICRAQSVDFLNILDRELRTALMCAVLGEKLDIIKLLLDCGADVTVKGPDGMTVLHLAAKLGQQEAVRLILESARKRLTARDLQAFVNGVDNGSYTALVWAAENRHKEVIQLLLEVGADVNICDKENNTSLHWAAMAGCSETMLLLVKIGCDPNVQNINGDTPLHLACRHENGTICILLLTMGASLNVRNSSNELPQDMVRNPNSECANIIAANVKISGLGKNAKETRILCSDISNGKEYYPVQVVHVAGRNDRHQPLPKFKYIRKSVQIESCIDINMCDMVVCSCKDSCTAADSSCLCSERTWYTEDGRLVSDFDFLEPPTIVECGDLCDCNQLLCRNRVVQRGLRLPLQLFYSPGKAWGVRTLVPIPKGTFLVEYVGELLADEVANQRPDDTYFFDLNSGFCIDANAYGNISRFFNHSCDPNVSPVSVYYEHQDKRFPKVAMFACRDIKAQEEICFNYGEKFWMVKNRTMSCLCNASECRYRTVQQGVVI